MPGPVAVTGASGFIGSRLLNALAARGEPVTALTRRPAVALPGVRWIRGDLDNRVALSDLTADAAVVIHCAGRVRGRSAAQFERTNISGTAHLLDAICRHRPAPRLLLISSLAACRPELSWYAASKRRSEQLVAERQAEIPATIFRPTAVYGPGDREIRPLLETMRRGYLPMIGAGNRRFSLLHVDDLVDAILHWLVAPADLRGTFELDDRMPGGYDWAKVRSIAEAAWGRRIRAVSIPPGFVHAAAWANLGLSFLTGRSPMLTPGKLRELTRADWLCDNSGVNAALGWQPRISLADALNDDALLGTRYD